jgi:hypothetical protein
MAAALFAIFEGLQQARSVMEEIAANGASWLIFWLIS